MNAPDHDLDEPQLQDIAAWRGVLRGLQLVRVGLGLGLTCAIASCVCGFPAALLAAPWWQTLLGWLFICLNLSSPIVIAIGMAFCCQAPAESGAKRYARAALTLALIFASMVLLLFSLAMILKNEMAGLESLRILIDRPKFAFVVLTMLLLDLTFAVHCWQLFLSATAAQFDPARLPSIPLNEYRWWFSGWAAYVFALFVYEHSTTGSFGVLGWLMSLLGLPAFSIIQMMLLQRLEDNIGPLIAPAPPYQTGEVKSPGGDRP